MEGGNVKMSFPYPAKPWFDGQTVTVNLNRYVMTGTYFAAKNVWSFVRTDTEGGIDADGNLAATSVLAPNIRPPANTVVPFAEQDTLNSQQEINWFLYDEIQRIRNELNLGD